MRRLLAVAMFLISATIFAQGEITGTVMDSEMDAPLPGANVVVVGTTLGTVTDFDGKFAIGVEEPTGTIEISFLGYESKRIDFNVSNGETLDLGNVQLAVDADALSEVVIIGKGVVDMALGRQTPVAVSTMRAEEIQETGGSMEFPSMLRSMPSVYANTSGGGYGDSEMHVRGFDQSNTAYLLNGQPINGMEDGNMYWSNWQGIKDVATAIQIQRGLGASKLAISSVGGTVNILTQTYNNVEEGYVMGEVAEGNYFKTTGYYTTGANDLGWSSTYMLSYWEGDGNFYEATGGKGITYFFSVGYKPSDEHAFNLLLTGAPQMHGQAYQGDIAAALEYGLDYNENWGYRNDEVYNERTNFYHKPVLNFNWDWNINEVSNLSTVGYASLGKGGGTGPLGRYSNKFNEQGQINFDEIIANNRSLPTTTIGGVEYRIGNHPKLSDPESPDYIEGDRGYITRASMNNHFWVGAVSNYNHELNENLEYNFGLDYRYYHGDHYRQVSDFLGLDGWYEDGNSSIPGGQVVFTEYEVDLFSPTFETARATQQIDYSNSEDISYIGGFGQIEYANDAFSTFLQGALSSQSHIRYDYFVYSLPENQESEKITNTGYNIKGGVNFNISEQHNVFANAGFYSRQPFHDNIFLNFTNQINPLTENEEITGLELGYGFDIDNLTINVNAYYTKWGNRAETRTSRLDLRDANGNFWNESNPKPAADDIIDGVPYSEIATEEEYFTNFNGLEQTHTGIEVDFIYEPIPSLRLNGFVSVGNWIYSDNPIQSVYDSDDLEFVEGLSGIVSYIDGEKVGSAPQTSFTLGAEYEVMENLSVDADWYYYADLYASIDPLTFTERGGEVIKLPAYDLVRLGASYTLPLNGNTSLDFRANVSNLFNEVYLSSLSTNDPVTPDAETYRGINTSNRGYFGYDRQWNLSVKYNF